jgi:hypothetical protein
VKLALPHFPTRAASPTWGASPISAWGHRVLVDEMAKALIDFHLKMRMFIVGCMHFWVLVRDR